MSRPSRTCRPATASPACTGPGSARRSSSTASPTAEVRDALFAQLFFRRLAVAADLAAGAARRLARHCAMIVRVAPAPREHAAANDPVVRAPASGADRGRVRASAARRARRPGLRCARPAAGLRRAAVVRRAAQPLRHCVRRAAGRARRAAARRAPARRGGRPADRPLGRPLVRALCAPCAAHGCVRRR